jgi:hypothetical protein
MLTSETFNQNDVCYIILFHIASVKFWNQFKIDKNSGLVNASMMITEGDETQAYHQNSTITHG